MKNYWKKYEMIIAKKKYKIKNYIIKELLKKQADSIFFNSHFITIYEFAFFKSSLYLNELTNGIIANFIKGNEKNQIDDNISKKELFIIINENSLKVGNTIKKSKRYDNIINMIFRNLIQKIFLDWINYGEIDKSKKLCRIDPIIFKKAFDFKGRKLKEIYAQKITEKMKKINRDHNIMIINSSKGIKNIKLNYTFEQALKLFYYKNNTKQDLSDIINIDEDKEKIIRANILEGLKGKEEYINRKIKGDSSYKKLLISCFDKIKEKYFK